MMHRFALRPLALFLLATLLQAAPHQAAAQERASRQKANAATTAPSPAAAGDRKASGAPVDTSKADASKPDPTKAEPAKADAEKRSTTRPNPAAGLATQRRTDRRRRRAGAATAGFRHRAYGDHRRTRTPLYRDRGHPQPLWPERRSYRCDLLHGISRQGCARRPPADVRFQWRPRRGVGLSAPRPGRSEDPGLRTQRPRRRQCQAHRQSAKLARLHRSRDDRSDRHRLEPHGKSRRCREFLWRAPRCLDHGQGDRPVCRAQQPCRIAEIPAR